MSTSGQLGIFPQKTLAQEFLSKPVRSKARGVFPSSGSHSAEDSEQIAQSGGLGFQDLLL
jgi:hypothetical protein